MKYQTHIRHINGDIITVIWDDDCNRFIEEVELAKKDIVAYWGIVTSSIPTTSYLLRRRLEHDRV